MRIQACTHAHTHTRAHRYEKNLTDSILNGQQLDFVVRLFLDTS